MSGSAFWHSVGVQQQANMCYHASVCKDCPQQNSHIMYMDNHDIYTLDKPDLVPWWPYLHVKAIHKCINLVKTLMPGLPRLANNKESKLALGLAVDSQQPYHVQMFVYVLGKISRLRQALASLRVDAQYTKGKRSLGKRCQGGLDKPKSCYAVGRKMQVHMDTFDDGLQLRRNCLLCWKSAQAIVLHPGGNGESTLA